MPAEKPVVVKVKPESKSFETLEQIIKEESARVRRHITDYCIGRGFRAEAAAAQADAFCRTIAD